MRIRVLHGPNLNLLGKREPQVYGTTTLNEIDQGLVDLGSQLGCTVTTLQSNHEGVLIDAVQDCANLDGFLVNPGGFGHTSIALRDAFLGVGLPFVEVHVSNLVAREEFRHESLLSDLAAGVVFGFGPGGYALGLRGLVEHLRAD